MNKVKPNNTNNKIKIKMLFIKKVLFFLSIMGYFSKKEFIWKQKDAKID